MFDGSSIEGWKAINESDMILKPDLDSGLIDPFSATPMMIITCDIVEPSTGDLYGRDPRSTAKRAEAYVKSTGMGDTVYVGPEAEFFLFDDVRFIMATTAAASKSTISNCRPTPTPSTKAATWPPSRAPRAATSRSPRSTATSTFAAKWSQPCSKWACPCDKHHHEVARLSTNWA
jgi:glutamine synthetase